MAFVILGLTLTEIGTALGTGALSSVGGKLFQSVTDSLSSSGDPTQEIKDKINEALNELKKIQAKIRKSVRSLIRKSRSLESKPRWTPLKRMSIT